MDRLGQGITAIDPGREKCGAAVLTLSGSVYSQEIVVADALIDHLDALLPQEGPLLIGTGTGCQAVRDRIESLRPEWAARIVMVQETYTTLDARKRYWQDHPPTGWRRLLPLSLQEPPRPIDDYAAVLLAERYLVC